MIDKVLIVLTTDTLGGAEKNLKMITKEFLRRGAKVDVVFYKKRRAGGWDDLSKSVNLHFTSFSKERYAYLTLPFRIWKLSRKSYTYTISSNVSVNGWMGIFKKLGILKSRYIIGREATLTLDRAKGWKRWYFKQFYKLGYSAIDLVIYQTRLMKEKLEQSEISTSTWKKNIVLPNAVITDEIQNGAKEEVELPTELPFILAVGRLKHVKGFDLLMEAFINLDPSYALIILGEGEKREQLESLSRELGIEDRVFLPGFVENPYPYMSKARCCVISSRVEGFPNSLLQMMALNERVVSTVCAGGIDEIQGVATCPINQSEALNEAMSSVLDFDDNRLKENRILFDKELNQRKISNYVDTIIKTVKT